MWSSFDELYLDAFGYDSTSLTFMENSDVKILYFNLLSKFKNLSKNYRHLSKDYKHLKFDFDMLTSKYNIMLSTTDMVPGYMYRKLNSKYSELNKDYNRILNANIKLSDELTYLTKVEQSEEDNS